MNDQPNILVVTDSPADAALISDLLSAEFANISTSTEPRCAVSDFEETRPALLILAFNTLSKAESYYSELKRQSLLARELPRQTLILCGQKDVLRVCALCKQQHYDDYILFWPVSSDPGRLSTTVSRALRQIANTNVMDRGELEQATATANHQLETSANTLARPTEEVGIAIAEDSENMSTGGLGNRVEVGGRSALQKESTHLGRESIDGSPAAQPARQSLGAISGRLAAAPESARALTDLGCSISPLLLIIDDDEFQHELLRQLFTGEAFDLAFGTSSVEALSLVHKRRPDLILMDIDLPDVDGVETTRLLKAVKQYADIPIVMMTGHGEQGVVIASKNAGASDYVVKPFARGTMLSKVRRLLQADPALECQTLQAKAVDKR